MTDIVRQPGSSPSQLSGFCGHTRHSSAATDLALVRVIHRTVIEARDAGLDHGGQTQQAILAVRQVRPDVRADEALTLVQQVRE
jgi:hypothetical protein